MDFNQSLSVLYLVPNPSNPFNLWTGLSTVCAFDPRKTKTLSTDLTDFEKIKTIGYLNINARWGGSLSA